MRFWRLWMAKMSRPQNGSHSRHSPAPYPNPPATNNPHIPATSASSTSP